MTATTCRDCVNYIHEYSLTGRAGKITKCLEDAQIGIPQVGTVTDTSDCAWYKKAGYNVKADVFPRRYVKENSDDDVAIVDTYSDGEGQVDPFRNVPKRTRRRIY